MRRKKDQDEPKTPRYIERERRGETTRAAKNTYLTYNKAVYQAADDTRTRDYQSQGLPRPAARGPEHETATCTAHNTTYNNRVGEEGKHIECFGSEAMQANDGRADLNLR